MDNRGLLRQNRFSINDFLKPKADEYAVASIWATYSLNDIVVLSNLISLQEDRALFEENIDQTPLRRLQSSCENTIIFYNQGCWSGSSKPRLIQIIDRNLIEVPRELSGPSFHPKFYFTKYKSKNTGSLFWRLAVVSRNMTTDVSMDIGIGLD